MPKKTIEEWEAQSALDTLKRAETIKTDKKMMFAVQKQITKEQAALNKVASKKTLKKKKK